MLLPQKQCGISALDGVASTGRAGTNYQAWAQRIATIIPTPALTFHATKMPSGSFPSLAHLCQTCTDFTSSE
jgi:hypothetical protein